MIYFFFYSFNFFCECFYFRLSQKRWRIKIIWNKYRRRKNNLSLSPGCFLMNSLPNQHHIVPFKQVFTTTFIDFYIALAKKILLLENETLKCMNFSETANSLLIKAEGNILYLQNLSTTHSHVMISKPQWVRFRNTQLDLKALSKTFINSPSLFFN